jgi:hypothetical protein
LSSFIFRLPPLKPNQSRGSIPVFRAALRRFFGLSLCDSLNILPHLAPFVKLFFYFFSTFFFPAFKTQKSADRTPAPSAELTTQ